MQSRPDLVGMVDGVLGFMRSDALKNPGPHAMHHARISINALELIKRELQLGPAADQEEHARLRALLGTDGSLEALNRLLCARIENGEIGLESDALRAHLWQTTMSRIAIDQPSYAGYRLAQEEGMPARSG
ncbi:MAG TPA: DUF6285 domain-containing protein [Quisquiliibacterium sp.]|nr:DUF6285 domain-containing protein [Quisquiliibacterium sp.]HQP67860.1 DUF6285 domain-containing protein [Quisquiliibacterium sp.]